MIGIRPYIPLDNIPLGRLKALQKPDWSEHRSKVTRERQAGHR